MQAVRMPGLVSRLFSRVSQGVHDTLEHEVFLGDDVARVEENFRDPLLKRLKDRLTSAHTKLLLENVLRFQAYLKKHNLPYDDIDPVGEENAYVRGVLIPIFTRTQDFNEWVNVANEFPPFDVEDPGYLEHMRRRLNGYWEEDTFHEGFDDGAHLVQVSGGRGIMNRWGQMVYDHTDAVFRARLEDLVESPYVRLEQSEELYGEEFDAVINDDAYAALLGDPKGSKAKRSARTFSSLGFAVATGCPVVLVRKTILPCADDVTEDGQRYSPTGSGGVYVIGAYGLEKAIAVQPIPAGEAEVLADTSRHAFEVQIGGKPRPVGIVQRKFEYNPQSKRVEHRSTRWLKPDELPEG